MVIIRGGMGIYPVPLLRTISGGCMDCIKVYNYGWKGVVYGQIHIEENLDFYSNGSGDEFSDFLRN